MDILFTTYGFIIAASLVIIISFWFGEFSKKTNIPSVLLLIVLGILIKSVLDATGSTDLNIKPILKVLGTVGLIMIVLEAALELELKPEKYLPIAKAFLIAFIGLLLSIWAAAEVLEYFIEGMTTEKAWLYATPLSILSSAIIIPSVTTLVESKKEFHIYESTFSDILGIMVFYFLKGNMHHGEHDVGGGGNLEYAFSVLATLVIALVASYLIVLVFQNIKSHTKLFLLIAVLLLLYAVAKQAHLSSLIIIFAFGLMMNNTQLFFKGRLGKWLNVKEAEHIYEGLHVITMETAFVIRTFFFVAFGMTIVLSSLASFQVAIVSSLIVLSIYIIRFVLLRIFIGSDILPQLFIAPRGLITILLFYDIPEDIAVAGFNQGILLFVIIVTGVIMTIAMIQDKNRTGVAVNTATSNPIGYEKWKAPTIAEVVESDGHHGH